MSRRKGIARRLARAAGIAVLCAASTGCAWLDLKQRETLINYVFGGVSISIGASTMIVVGEKPLSRAAA